MTYEVGQPIQNSPFDEPARHWYIQRGRDPKLVDRRRDSFVFGPKSDREAWDLSDGMLRRYKADAEGNDYEDAYELALVNTIRARVAKWRTAGYPGVTRTTLELLNWWRRDGRAQRLFFAQLEAAETIIFLREARQDLLQGVNVPREELSDSLRAEGYAAFQRYACKMATGTGKTTVMAMLAAWSILNKVTARADGRFSDAVLVVCPNITIRDRLRELDPAAGEASVYRTRDLVPPEMMPMLTRGRVLVTNWHVFEPQQTTRVGDDGARVVKAGVPVEDVSWVYIGDKVQTARGRSYLTLEEYEKRADAQVFTVLEEKRNENGKLVQAKIFNRRYVESDAALLERVLGREIGKKQNLLVFNDEAHHAYRILQASDADRDETDEESLLGTAEDDDVMAQEATVWVEGLDRIHKHRGINLCIDLSATPYFLARAGRDTGRPFPWTVSDFGLVDAIESGLVKIPQLAATDASGAERAQYFNVWEFVMKKLSPTEKGRGQTGPKPEAVLKHAAQPIAMLAGEWRKTFEEWKTHEDGRPPVFILVCKDIKIAKCVYEWIAEGKQPLEIAPFAVPELKNADGVQNTIRVDTKVVTESDSGASGGGAKADEARWMRFTLDTVGKRGWPRDRQGRSIYPPGFEELAKKLERPLHPPGRDVRCIVSVGMLTEGWDANTVTHIIGIRPFMSQLLCEQVVGRGLRRASYDVGADGRFGEEVAQVFGVPFEIVPFKGTGGAPTPKPKRFHVVALDTRAKYEIRFPRVEGYTQAVRNRVTVRDWSKVPTLKIVEGEYPTFVETGPYAVDSKGVAGARGPGRSTELTMDPYNQGVRVQRGIFQMAAGLTKSYLSQARGAVPAHALFPQLVPIVERFVKHHVVFPPQATLKQLFNAPFYGWAIERLVQHIVPDEEAGEAPELPRFELLKPEGSTADVDYWTSKDVRETKKSHVNYLVADTVKWEQQAGFYLERNKSVEAYVKNAGLGFAIPYLHDGQMHDFVPDFICRFVSLGDGQPPRFLILETKGYDPLDEVKEAAAQRWCAAVNADGRYGTWRFAMARKMEDVPFLLDESAASPVGGNR
jgi:type III restriction enzyme